MNRTIILFLSGFFVSLFTISAQEYDTLWSKTTVSAESGIKKVTRQDLPNSFKIYNLNVDLLKSKLANTPQRKDGLNKTSPIISFPNGKGTFERFRVFEASIMEEELQRKYSNIRSYIGKSIDNPGSIIRFSYSPYGLNALLFQSKGAAIIISPYTSDNKTYVVYKQKDVSGSFKCGVDELNYRAQEYIINGLCLKSR